MGETIKTFKITTNRRYWEDEDFGIMVKRGAQFTIYPKHLRSYMLKFSIMRGDVNLVEKETCTFGFKGRIFDIVGGKDKNLITIISEHGEKCNKKFDVVSTRNAAARALKPKREGVIVIPEPKKVITKPIVAKPVKIIDKPKKEVLKVKKVEKEPIKAISESVNTDPFPETI